MKLNVNILKLYYYFNLLIMKFMMVIYVIAAIYVLLINIYSGKVKLILFLEKINKE
jgi:hypothetical protein